MKTKKDSVVRVFVIPAFFFLLAWMASPAVAWDHRFKKKVDVGALQAQLVTAGYGVDFIECSGENCTIHLKSSETKNPQSIVDKYVHVDRMAMRAQNLNKIKILAAKFDSGSISASEKDELLRLMIKQVTGF